MNASAPSPAKTLRRLFLTLFLRGRTSRGLRKEGAPKSVGNKLALVLLLYALFGCFALVFMRQPVFSLSAYLHGMTLMFVGMFVASSAGEVLFNKEEADILLHRPVTPRELLWAKISVLVQVSLWLAGAFNLAGWIAGAFAPDGSWLFLPAHAISITLEALFGTGFVVLAYQLCLRFLGRERLESLMTTVQVVAAIGTVLGGQIVPRLIIPMGDRLVVNTSHWWVCLLPPAWFAGLDDAIAGSGAGKSWALAATGLVVTTVVLWLAFGKLANDYGTGLQMLNETSAKPARRGGRRRWLDVLVNVPPLRWWLRDPVSRASFLLVGSYLARDRDVKLRVYPSLAPMLIMPFVFLLQGRRPHESDNFGVMLCSGYLGVIPLLGMNLLQYSQQWQATDLFRVAPMLGPASLCHGARRAVLFFLTLPLLLGFGTIVWFMVPDSSGLLLLLPGALMLPVFAMVPCLGGHAVPLSQPIEEAKSATRGLSMMAVMLTSFAISGLAFLSWHFGWFKWYLLVESLAVIIVYLGMRASLSSARWSLLD